MDINRYINGRETIRSFGFTKKSIISVNWNANQSKNKAQNTSEEEANGAGLSFKKRAIQQYTLDNKLAPNPSLFGEDLPISENENQQFDLSDSCGVCPSCMKASKLVHPDIHFTIPTISGLRTDRATISNDLIAKWRSFILENPYGNTLDWLQYIEAENKQANITAAECEEIHRILSLKSF